MQKFIKSNSGKYLEEKYYLEKSIIWYIRNIHEVDVQQKKRREALENLQKQLHDLEKDYYTNG